MSRLGAACVIGLALALALSVGHAQTQPTARPAPQAGQGAEPATAPVEAAFARWDADHDGVLSPGEFRAGWIAQARAARRAAAEALQARLRGQFEAVDGNDDEAIDAGEYPRLVLVRRAGKSAPALSLFDGNHDGRLQFAEYLQLVRQLAKPDRAGKAP